jgi:hypothetical protein
VLVFTLVPLASAKAATPESCGGIMGVLTCNPIVRAGVSIGNGVATGNPVPAISGAVQLGQAVTAGWMHGFAGNMMASSINAIGAAATGVIHELAGPTLPKSFPSWFMDAWGVTGNLGFQILFLCYVIAIIAGVIKANLARVVQAPILSLAIILGMFTVLAAVSVGVQVVDWASLQILAVPVDAMVKGFTMLKLEVILAGPGSNLLVGFLGTFLLLIAFGVLYLNLLVRKWIVYIAAGLLGLALSGSLTKSGARWCKFLAVLIGAVVVSKLLLVAILAYGVGALTSPQSLSDVFAGGAVVLVSGLSPWLLVSIIWGGSMGVLHGGLQTAATPGRQGRRAFRSAMRTHNHWQSWGRQQTAKRTKAATAARKQQAAASKAAAVRAGASAKVGTAAAGAATGGVAVAVGAAAKGAKKAATAARRVPATLAATGAPIPHGTTQTPSGLVVPKPGFHLRPPSVPAHSTLFSAPSNQTPPRPSKPRSTP